MLFFIYLSIFAVLILIQNGVSFSFSSFFYFSPLTDCFHTGFYVILFTILYFVHSNSRANCFLEQCFAFYNPVSAWFLERLDRLPPPGSED